jgi:RNA polymerase sigma factor (sigma-70 family)
LVRHPYDGLRREDVTVDERDLLAESFEANRTHLRAVAYRMLGSVSEADDAVQESWLRLNRSGAGDVENLRAWLTTVVARVCLDMLRARRSRREEPLGAHVPEPIVSREDGVDPEHEALVADSVGLALLVVLETLAPQERLAFVLHDMFGVPFDEIAPIVGRSPAAARQLASRARRRVRGATPTPEVDLARQREVVDAFLAAARSGDFEALLAVLDPDVVLRVDRGAVPRGASREVRGAPAVVGQVRTFARLAAFARPALVNGAAGFVVAIRGRPLAVAGFAVAHGRIVEIDLLADPARLRELDLTLLDN